MKNYKSDISQFIFWFENEFHLPFDPSKISLQIFETYKKIRGISERSMERHTSSLRKFFKFLIVEGIISQDPFDKKTVSAETLAKEDPWMLRNFKSFLYEYKKSNLTIKNYINDMQSFFEWLEEAALIKYAWNVADKNLLDKINFSVIAEYKQRLIAAKFSPRTINRKLSSLRNYVNWAKSQGFIKNFESPTQNTITAETSILTKKSTSGINLLFDNVFISPIAEMIQNTQYLFWKASGKKIFIKSNLIIKDSPKIPISNIQKEFYAPLNISTHYLPIHKRIWHYIRHIRPKWYKQYHSYSFTHYFHFAILVILSCIVGFGIYDVFFANAQKGSTLAATSFAPPRILSFQGKLTDSSETPITEATAILFSLYNDENASAAGALWTETNSIKPDSDGIFSVFLGKKTPISDTVFSQNSKLFLGITVGNSPELLPRQELATVPFASNSETLQGLEPITNTAKVSNVVLALDSSGNLNIADTKAHTFQTIGGQFILSGKVLSLITTLGSNSNIEIVPDGRGKIDLSKPIHNSTNNNNLTSAVGSVEFDDTVAILATTSAQAALYINQNSTGVLISASTSGTAKFVVENDGTGKFTGDLGVNGGDITTASTTFNLLNSAVTTLNFAGAATNLVLGADSGTITIRNSSASIQGNVTLGDSATDTVNFTGRIAQDSSIIPITTSGTNDLGSSALPWDNSYLNNIYAVKLDLQDSQSATTTAQIFNTNSGTDADGLLLKLGNISTDTVSNTNHFISFETSGIGIVGSVQGSGGKGVTYATSGIADFAEYLKKDKNQIIEYGSLVCMGDDDLAVKCDNFSSNILGVASEHPTFLGGENLGDKSVAVGLVGQVETFVSISNGAIKAGDLLTASDIPGVAVKSTKAGQIVGKALEDINIIDESKVIGFYDPENKEYRSKDNFPNIPIKSDIIKIFKIYALINVSWHDPGAYLAQTGELVIQKVDANNYAISNPQNETLTNIEGFFKIIAANIKTGLISAQEIITNTLIVTSDSIIINGQNLKDYIVAIVNESEMISPILSTNQLSTNIISPLAPDSNISVTLDDSQLIIHDSNNASGSAVAMIDNQGNARFAGDVEARRASFSGQLQTNELLTNQLTTGNASVSGTLRAGNIIADSISGLDEQISTIYSSNFADFIAERGQFNQGLMVFGPTSLSDIAIAGRLSIGGSMFVTENSIETLGADLSLQSLRQGGLSIMDKLVYIDTLGNVEIQGDLSVRGKLAVNIISPLPASDLVINNASGSSVLSINQTGDVVASGSGTFTKLNFSLVAPVLALSATEVIASSSAGVANIAPYHSEITIINSLVTDKSVIYITPVGTPSAQTPFLMRQTPYGPASPPASQRGEQGGSFTVGVASPTNHSLDFNWLIVN